MAAAHHSPTPPTPGILGIPEHGQTKAHWAGREFNLRGSATVHTLTAEQTSVVVPTTWKGVPEDHAGTSPDRPSAIVLPARTARSRGTEENPASGHPNQRLLGSLPGGARAGLRWPRTPAGPRQPRPAPSRPVTAGLRDGRSSGHPRQALPARGPSVHLLPPAPGWGRPRSAPHARGALSSRRRRPAPTHRAPAARPRP